MPVGSRTWVDLPSTMLQGRGVGGPGGRKAGALTSKGKDAERFHGSRGRLGCSSVDATLGVGLQLRRSSGVSPSAACTHRLTTIHSWEVLLF